MKGIRIFTDKGEYDYGVSNDTTSFMAIKMFLKSHKDMKVLDTMIIPKADIRKDRRVLK